MLAGEARGVVVVPEDRIVLLEVLADAARDLSPLSMLAPDSIDALWLGNTWVDDGQLAHTARLTDLQWLDIQNNGQVTDAGIAELRPLRALRSLGLHWTHISNKSLDVFRELPCLEYLDLWGCEISTEALDAFRHVAAGCEIRT